MSKPRMAGNFPVNTEDKYKGKLVRLEQEGLKWRKLTTLLTEQKQQLEQQLAILQKENKAIKEDYEQFVSIMNRARRLVTLEADDEPNAPTFKMERNGNLIPATNSLLEDTSATI